MKNFEYDNIKELVSNSRSVVVTSHYNPDGDAIGAALAMTLMLRKMGKRAVAMIPNDYPGFLKWMPGSNDLLVYRQNESNANGIISSADLFFCLDYSGINRTGDMEEALRKAQGKKILIDHHLEPVLSDFDFYLSQIKISSTSELLYRFFEGCSWLDLIDKDIATSLFVGIMTDTGSFSFSCNYPETFEITALLLRTGINPEQIHRLIYDTYSEDRLRLLGYCLSNKLTILPDISTAYIALSIEDLEQFHHQVGDTEGIVNYALSIDTIKIAVLLTERKDRIRLSFRSKGNLSVKSIARDHFNGGGHKNASGGESQKNLTEAVQQFRQLLPLYKEMLCADEL